MNLTYSTNIVILGGGIAGLWLLNRMQTEGHDPILFETKALGGKQTLASQGIIHGGLKYALKGALGEDSKNIANMPNRWRQCLNGTGEVDLTGVKVLDENYYMWSDGGLRSRLKSYLGSKSLRGRVDVVSKDSYPNFFRQSSVKGTLYKLPDFVMDTNSLLQKLVFESHGRIFSLANCKYKFLSEENTPKQKLEIVTQDKIVTIEANLFIFCAGEGNSELISKAKLNTIKSQTRPLHMVYLKKSNLPKVYVHCIGNNFSLNPLMTVTSHETRNGQIVWYLGGDIAESGIDKSKSEQIKTAEELMLKTFPWMNLTGAKWESFLINRSEGQVQSGSRPEDAIVRDERNVLVAWPTKLTLVPSLADQVLTYVARLERTLLEKTLSLDKLQSLFKTPSLASTHWD